MATDVSVPNNFVAGTPSVADDVDANFAALVTWVNTNAVHLDGSKAFTSVPSGPATDPSSDNQLARKAYVDAKADLRVGVRVSKASEVFTAANGLENFNWSTEVEDTHGFIAAPGTTITIPAGYAGTYVVSAVVFNITTMTSANFSGASLNINGIGVPLGGLPGATSTISGSYVTPLAAGNTITLGIDTTSNGTASAYLNVYRISA